MKSLFNQQVQCYDNPGFIPVDSKGVPVNPNPQGLFNADYSRYYGKTWYHEGIDISVDQGTDIKAFIYGTVVLVGDNGGKNYGRFVIIQDDFNTTKFYLCAHLSEVKVEIGDSVIPGDIIGLVGNTGNSSGPHLHLMLFIENNSQMTNFFAPGTLASSVKTNYYYFNYNNFNKYVFDPLNHKIRRKG